MGQSSSSTGSTYPQSGSGTATGSSGNSTSGSGSTYGQNQPGSSSGSMGQSGTAGQAGSTGSGSTYGQSGSADASMGQTGTSGSASAPGGDTGGLRQVTGQVAKVDQTANSITLDQASGGLTLTVDQNTKVQRNGKATMGLTGIREGEQVRASFDPASNRADSIEVMSRRHRGKRGSSSSTGPAGTTGSPGQTGTNPSDTKSGTPTNPK
ncbi:MAG TPA: hypothetical protein VN883_01850 [Myxococcales bacterium]|nr:hypothetical protein [Myxococcales bacterium]